MSAAYDNYDYPSYWLERQYEHKSEFIAIKRLLEKINYIKTILEVGAGFGRLVPSYSFRAKKIILTDPSAKLLSIARLNCKKTKNVIFLQSSLSNLPGKLNKNSIDLIIMVRVLHHINDVLGVFKSVNYLLKDGGYFILEFANKSHLKATFSEIFKGNTTFPLDIFPKDVRCKKSIKNNTIPFNNFHPESIVHMLTQEGFEIVDKLSVSNIRSSLLKNFVGINTLLGLEKFLQKPLSYISFGPSIFLLVRKRGD